MEEIEGEKFADMPEKTQSVLRDYQNVEKCYL